MQRRTPAAALFLGLASLSLVACGRIFIAATVNPGKPGTASVSLSLRDTPAGVTVLSAAVSVTGAVLQPGNVSLLNAPVRVQLRKLETETALLGFANVPAGALTGLNVSLANPQLTILNTSGAPLAGCPSGAVCELRPRLAASSVFVPAALVLDANRPVGLVLDFDLNRSLQGDLTIQPTLGATTLFPLLSSDPLEDVNDFLGQVTAVGASQFTLQNPSSGLVLAVQVDAFTQFGGFPQAGLPNDFTGVRVGQILAADLRLLANGTLRARRVTLEEVANTQVVEGVVVSADAANGRITLVVLDEVPDIAGVAPGNRVTVNVQPGASFVVDGDGLTVPPGVSFSGPADLLAGQEIQARVRAVASDSSGISLSTDRVRLRMSQFTAGVAARSGNGFTLGGLPGLFTSAEIAAIQVPASLETNFENVSGLAGLNPGDVVSLRGLLFPAATSPTLVARKVRRR